MHTVYFNYITLTIMQFTLGAHFQSYITQYITVTRKMYFAFSNKYLRKKNLNSKQNFIHFLNII